MSDFVFNIAKGRTAEFYNRVKSNDPATSGLVLVVIDRGAEVDGTLVDLDTLAAVLALVTERNTNGWERKVLTDADLAALTVDDSNNRMPCDIPDQTWLGPLLAGGASTDLLICYDGDTTGGVDSAIIPLTCHAFATTPDGSDIIASVTDFYRAS